MYFNKKTVRKQPEKSKSREAVVIENSSVVVGKVRPVRGIWVKKFSVVY